MVLITNQQSNILQDIDSLHLFAQVVTNTCKSLDEREILRNAFELISAFDELVTLGYRENLTISQIKTFLEMESHEERIQEIIARVRRTCDGRLGSIANTATEQRAGGHRGAQEEGQAAGDAAQGGGPERARWGWHVPAVRLPNIHPASTAGRHRVIRYIRGGEKQVQVCQRPRPTTWPRHANHGRFTAPKGKGMQLGKKSKTTDMFERVKGELGPVDDTPLVPIATPSAPEPAAAPRASTSLDRDAIHVTINEAISAKISRDGGLNSFSISGDLTLRVSDPSLTKLKMKLNATPSHGAQFRTHPNVDKNAFNSSKAIQMTNLARGFPVNNAVGVLRWRATPKADDASILPISFTVWVNKGSDGNCTLTIEYELTGNDTLKDVSVVVPFASAEPSISSFDAVYEVSGDSLEWSIGTVSEENASGSFEFEAQTDDEDEFFPMQVRFLKTSPFVDVDVSSLFLEWERPGQQLTNPQVQSVELLEMDEEVTFSKEIKSVAEGYVIE